ncbi:MAG: lysophospholipid acyltransferase family protein [Fibrobacterota bacterium]
MKDLFEYGITIFINTMARLLPLRAGFLMADIIAVIFFDLLRIRRNISVDNYLGVFPEKDKKEAVRAMRKTYMNFCRAFVETVKFRYAKKEKTGSFLCGKEGIELLESALSENRGAVLVTGHFGNWEAGVFALRRMGFPFTAILKRQHNRYFNEYVESVFREMEMNFVYSNSKNPKAYIRAIKNKEILGIVADQDAGKKGVFVNFLGKPSSTNIGPAFFHLKYKMPVLIGLGIRINNKIKIVIEKIDIPPGLEYSEENVKLVTQKHTEALEKYIRKYPDQWSWMHKRWKTRPPKGVSS